MAKIPKPGRKTGLVMSADIMPGDALGRPAPGKLQDLNFKVDPDFHYSFKMEAVKRRMSMQELLRASFLEFIERHPAE